MHHNLIIWERINNIELYWCNRVEVNVVIKKILIIKGNYVKKLFRVNFRFTLCGLVTLTVLLQTFKNSHFTP
ncbi:hypothetical protein Hanom_Chr03g00179681 [Helianthus anomalus]